MLLSSVPGTIRLSIQKNYTSIYYCLCVVVILGILHCIRNSCRKWKGNIEKHANIVICIEYLCR